VVSGEGISPDRELVHMRRRDTHGLDLRAYVVALSGILCLAFAEGLPWVGFLLAGILTWGYWSSSMEEVYWVNAVREKRLMAMAFFLSFLEFVGRGSGREAVIFSLGHALAVAQCVNAFKKRAGSDFAHAFMVGAAHLLLAVSFPPMLFTMVYLVVFILILPGALYRLAHLRLMETGSAMVMWKGRFSLWPFVLPVTILVFISMPRDKRYVRWDVPGAWSVSGLSSRLSIGGLSPVLQSNEVVMRVKASAPNQWRGMAYDTYEYGNWSVSPKGSKPFKKEMWDGTLEIQIEDSVHEQVYWIERPVPDRILCAVPRVLNIESDGQATAHIGPLGNLYWSEHVPSGFRYTVQSAVQRIRTEELRSDERSIPVSFEEQYTQLPPLSSRVKELAERIAGSATTTYDIVVAIERYLAGEYTYSLAPGRAQGEPVEWFLFQSKMGYCEHFATAMVVLLRSLGIPSRPVNGFQAGERTLGDVYLVRARDAHAWVEVYFPSHGWVPFDPTPSLAGSGALVRMARWVGAQWDLLRLRWFRYVVNFSNWNQQRILGRVQGMKKQVQIKVRDWNSRWMVFGWNHTNGAVLVLMVSFLLCIVGCIVWRRWVRRKLSFLKRLGLYGRRGSNALEEEQMAILFYRRMLGLLENKGYLKKRNQGPLEFERSLGGMSFDMRQQVQRLTRMYCEVRFGQRALDPAMKASVENSLGSLERALKGRATISSHSEKGDWR